MRHKNRPRAFSLIELAVVIGIIAVLLAILLPTLSAVRRSAKVTQCASNLRQIGQAMQTYRSDHKVWPYATAMPPPFQIPPVGDLSAPSVPDALAGYLSPTSAVYRCPGDTSEVFDRCLAEPAATGVSRGISYWYWTAFHLPKPNQVAMADFQGFSGPKRTVNIGMFHPPRYGMNALQMDGSVTFGYSAQ